MINYSYILRIFIYLCLPWIMTPFAEGQTARSSRDIYVLLTTPYNLRPLSPYRGQVKAEGGYKFSVRSNSYNSEGQTQKITNMNTGSVYHYYYATVEYGVTDFFGISAETDMIRLGQREVTVKYESVTANSRDQVTTSTLKETKGLGDLLLMATLRFPERKNWIDISATGGLYIPVAEHEAQMPANTIKVVTSTTANITTTTSQINIKENYRHGYGVPVFLLSASVKGGYWKYSSELKFSFLTPKEEGISTGWSTSLVDKVFTYTKKTYSYLLSNAFSFDGSLHYQATGWFDIYLNTEYRASRGGWTEKSGIRYANLETSVLAIEPGFELQVSPSLQISQTAGFPLSGRNAEAPFWLFTSLKYSFFPFPNR